MAGFKKFGSLANAFGKQPSAIGRMNAPAMELHPDTMKPMTAGPIGLPKSAGAAASMQSPAQHAAVEKAAQASAVKRKKGGLL